MAYRTQKFLMRLILWSMCFFILSIQWPDRIVAGDDPKPLLIATVHEKNKKMGDWIDLTYKEAFRRLNLSFEYIDYPLKRSSVMLNSGHLDGCVGRVYSYGESYPNVIRVNEPIGWVNIVAYSTNPNLSLSHGWESLKDTAYRVEYLRGFQLCETELSKVVSPQNLSIVNHWSMGLKKLHLGRTDIFISPEDFIIPALTKEPIKILIFIA